MELLGDLGYVVSFFSLFQIVIMLTQDWSTVCVEHTIGSEINLEAHDGTAR
jgi:hypothetical protein